MVTPNVQAKVAEAAYWLRVRLRTNSGWRRKRQREQALREYLAEVTKAHLYAMFEEAILPGEEEAESRLGHALEHAVREAELEEIRQAVLKYKDELAKVWRVGYLAEQARRWQRWQVDPRLPQTSPEREAEEAMVKIEGERRKPPVDFADGSSEPARIATAPRVKPKKEEAQYPNRAAWLRKVLEEKKLSARALSEMRHGPDQKTVSKILRGLPVSEKSLERLAQALKISPDQIPSD